MGQAPATTAVDAGANVSRNLILTTNRNTVTSDETASKRNNVEKINETSMLPTTGTHFCEVLRKRGSKIEIWQKGQVAQNKKKHLHFTKKIMVF